MGDLYILYDAAAGSVTVSRSGQPSISPLHQTTGVQSGWTHIVPGHFGGASTDFLFYDASNGSAEFHACDEQGNLSLLRAYTDWSPGHTHIVPGDFGGTGLTGQTDLLIYDAGSGHAAFFDVWGHGNMNQMKAYTNWSPGHTHIVPGDFGGTALTGQTDLLIYDAGSGHAAFFDVWGQGNINQMKAYTNWSPGHTAILSGNFGGARQTARSDLMIYDAAGQTVAFFDVWGQGNINEMQGSPTGAWLVITECADVLAPPVVGTGGATQIGLSAATLSGTVLASVSPAGYHFEYGATTSYGSTAPVPDGSVGPGAGPQGVFQAISGLQPGTTYHYRLVATTAGGTTRGSDHAFETTAPITPPPPHGVSRVSLFNCSSNGDEVSIWAWDETTGGPWEEIGSQPAQYDGSGVCPGVGASPITFTPANAHLYQLVAVDTGLLTCSGNNDPSEAGCLRWSWLVEGDPSGPAVTQTIS